MPLSPNQQKTQKQIKLIKKNKNQEESNNAIYDNNNICTAANDSDDPIQPTYLLTYSLLLNTYLSKTKFDLDITSFLLVSSINLLCIACFACLNAVRM